MLYLQFGEWRSLASRQVHNLKIGGSNPPFATKLVYSLMLKYLLREEGDAGSTPVTLFTIGDSLTLGRPSLARGNVSIHNLAHRPSQRVRYV